MARTAEMFEKPERPRRVRMHVIDGCSDLEGCGPGARFACGKCGHETDWILASTPQMRGIPCPKCNLCPHGMPLADNTCGPCSQGRPNRATNNSRGDSSG